MQYMTIALNLLKQRPETHDQLCQQRKLLPTVRLLATELKDRHQAWKGQLSQARPGSDESQIASEALEMALKELEGCLPSASPPDGSEPLSLDEAIAFLRNHMPPG
jgi:hypothetical protein